MTTTKAGVATRRASGRKAPLPTQRNAPDLAIGTPGQPGQTVLVLQGPPGTGKTRLIRAILGEMSRRKGGEAQALYTGDMKALETDQIFVKFITGWDDAFVVEDADHLLKPRARGNEHQIGRAHV